MDDYVRYNVQLVCGFLFALFSSLMLFLNPLIHVALIAFSFLKRRYNPDSVFFGYSVRGIMVSYMIILTYIYIMACFCFYGTVLGI